MWIEVKQIFFEGGLGGGREADFSRSDKTKRFFLEREIKV